MKGQILMRPLSTGDALLFAKNKRNLYLVSAKHVKTWNSGNKSAATLRRMMKADQIRRFTPRMLAALQKAIKRINFKL